MIYKYVLTEEPNGYCVVQEYVLHDRNYLRRIADDCYNDGFYAEAHWYDHAAYKAITPVWDYLATTGDYFFDLPPTVRAKILRQYGCYPRPGTYYVCLY